MVLEAHKKVEADAFHLDNGYICHTLDGSGSRGLFYGDDPLRFTLPGLLLQISLISMFTRATHFLLKPFGQPSIVSQILVSTPPLFFVHFLFLLFSLIRDSGVFGLAEHISH